MPCGWQMCITGPKMEEVRRCEAEARAATVGDNVQHAGITFAPLLSLSLCALSRALFAADGNIAGSSLPMWDHMCFCVCVCVQSHTPGCKWVRFTWPTTSIHSGDKHSPVARATSSYFAWPHTCMCVNLLCSC